MNVNCECCEEVPNCW